MIKMIIIIEIIVNNLECIGFVILKYRKLIIELFNWYFYRKKCNRYEYDV